MPIQITPKRHLRRKISSSLHRVFVFSSIMARIRLSSFQAENELCDQQSIPARVIFFYASSGVHTLERQTLCGAQRSTNLNNYNER